MHEKQGHLSCKPRKDGEDQLVAAQMSAMDTLLDKTQEEAIPLVQWAFPP